jgi:hypothetical protein
LLIFLALELFHGLREALKIAERKKSRKEEVRFKKG